MLTRRHRQHLDNAIGELDQSVGLVGQLEILLRGPETLQRAEVEDQFVLLPQHPQSRLLYIDRHQMLPSRTRGVSHSIPRTLAHRNLLFQPPATVSPSVTQWQAPALA